MHKCGACNRLLIKFTAKTNKRPFKDVSFVYCMKYQNHSIGLCLAIVALATACTNKKTELESIPLAEYFPQRVGKTITYLLDSTVTTTFGADTTVRSYRVKDTWAATITDGLGRPSFRVERTISNAAGTTPYTPNATFMSTQVKDDWVEWQENNLRFMKLRFPVLEGFSWKGNSFIETSTFNSPVRYLAGWEYRYTNVGAPLTLNGKTYDHTITILQRDEVIPEGPFNRNVYKQWNYSVEIYARGVGLIYKNFDHKVWQPPTPPPDARAGYFEDGSYRIILSALDFN